MRIAIIVSFQVGKTTLIEEFSHIHKHVRIFQEAYHSLEEDGFDFNHPPEEHDYEAMIKRSCQDILESPQHSLFDRCPLDYMALACASESQNWSDLPFDLDHIRDAMNLLDIVVYIPIESPDRITLNPDDTDHDFRHHGDDLVKELLFDDPLNLTQGIQSYEISGSMDQRVAKLTALIKS